MLAARLRHMGQAALLVVLASACGCAPGSGKGFARMENGRIMVDGRAFFPLAINYPMTIYWDGNDIWAGSYESYHPGRPPLPKDAALAEVRAEFDLMRAIGFNTVRIVQLTEGPRPAKSERSYGLRVRTREGRDTTIAFDQQRLWPRYLEVAAGVIEQARTAGLKVILLTTIHAENAMSREHFARIADRLRDEPAILAFDLFNEPLYFDSIPHTKQQVHAITKEWHALMRSHAPNHLCTIGLSGIREVHAWDPNILDVDLVSFHPYEYEPGQVLNEIRWYGTHVHIPWMIGETSLPADDDSVSYDDQVMFARRTLEQVRACGGIGYSWWQLKDVRWGRFHSDFMGVMDLHGTTTVPGTNQTTGGTLKPVSAVFGSFDPDAPVGDCLELPNYLNYSEHRTARLVGKLVDEKGAPIEGGVILGWNEYFSHSYHTTSRSDGTFDLLGDMYFHHWIASAVDHSMVRGDCHPGSYRRGADGIPSCFIGSLRVEKLDFHD